MGETVKCHYLGKETTHEELMNRNHYSFDTSLERYENHPYKFYILENGKKISRKIPNKTYDIGDIVVFPKSDKSEYYKVVALPPSDFFLIEIQLYEKPRNPIGFKI